MMESTFSAYEYLNLFLGKFHSKTPPNVVFTLSENQMIYFLVEHFLAKSETEKNVFEVSTLGFFILYES